MTQKQKNIGLLLIAAILLFSFTNKRKPKGSLIINPDIPNNIFALPLSKLTDSTGQTLQYFTGGEYLAILGESNDLYFVSYIQPGGNEIQGYILKTETEIK
jgi:hypothetical protein